METLGLKETEKILPLLKSGRTLIFPTETSYGLGCEATSTAAVEKIFKIKERSRGKSLLVVVPDIKMAKKYLKWSPAVEQLAQKHWPGELTVVGNYRRRYLGKNLARGVVSAAGTVAVRVTAHPFLKEITSKLGRPLVATSANLAGAGEIYDPAEIKKMFSGREIIPDAMVDAGKLPLRKPTTLVSVTSGKTQILREGEIKVRL